METTKTDMKNSRNATIGLVTSIAVVFLHVFTTCGCYEKSERSQGHTTKESTSTSECPESSSAASPTSVRVSTQQGVLSWDFGEEGWSDVDVLESEDGTVTVLATHEDGRMLFVLLTTWGWQSSEVLCDTANATVEDIVDSGPFRFKVLRFPDDGITVQDDWVRIAIQPLGPAEPGSGASPPEWETRVPMKVLKSFEWPRWEEVSKGRTRGDK